MQKQAIAFLILAATTLVTGCGRPGPSNINVEQAHNPAAWHILAPGMGTIGIITDATIDVYYHDEDRFWVQDPASRFHIPENNKGVLALGMGSIGVITGRMLHVYRLDPYNQWREEEHFAFELPGRYDRLLAVHMPWELGVIGVETEGMVDFYYFYDGAWQADPGATFHIPSGITAYYPLGDMTLAVVDGKKLGLYYLGPEGGWEFMDQDPYVLLLPGGYDGIIPFNAGMLAILKDNRLDFYQLSLEREQWIRYNDLQFELPPA